MQPAQHESDARASEQERGHIEGGHGRTPGIRLHPGLRPIGEDQSEMQKQRGQREPRDDIGPPEEIVQAIELAAGVKGKGAKERDGQPEEVQRRLISRPAQAHRGADEHREDADRRQRIVQPELGQPHRLQGQADRLLRGLALNHVGQRTLVPSPLSGRRDVTLRPNLAAIDQQQDVTKLNAGPLAGRPSGHFLGDDVGANVLPEDAVFRLPAPGADRRNVDQRQADQYDRNRHGESDAEHRTKALGKTGHVSAGRNQQSTFPIQDCARELHVV